MSQISTTNIIEFLKSHRGGVAFAEFHNNFSGCDGDFVYSQDDLDKNNIILWGGMSKLFLDSFVAASMEIKIKVTHASPLVYSFEGLALQLPIAKSPRYKYKELRWLPVVLSYCDLVEEGNYGI